MRIGGVLFGVLLPGLFASQVAAGLDGVLAAAALWVRRFHLLRALVRDFTGISAFFCHAIHHLSHWNHNQDA